MTTKLFLKGNLLAPGSKDAYETAQRRKSTCSVLQEGHICDQVTFHSGKHCPQLAKCIAYHGRFPRVTDCSLAPTYLASCRKLAQQRG